MVTRMTLGPFSCKREAMPGLKFTPYDSADYLDSEAAITAYLDTAKIEGNDDPTDMAHAQSVATRARARITTASPPGKTEPESPAA